MSSFASNIFESAGIYLINRYLGDLFTKKIALDNVNVSFTGQYFSLSDLELNTQYINENLEKLGISLEVTEGHVDELSLTFPIFEFLSSKPIEVTIDRLLLCVRARKGGPVGELNDIICSMIGSMMTSREIAEEYFATAPERQRHEGVESCEELLAGITTRIMLKAQNVVLRLENPSEDSEYATAVECHIDSVKIVDDRLDAFESQPQNPEADRKAVFSLSTINKTVHLAGVKFYTDICSKVEETSSMFTSLHQRQRRPSSAALEDFKTIPSDPIQFGQLVGDDNVIKISVSEEDDNSPQKVKIGLNLQSLHLFVNPSQVHIIKEILDSFLVPNPGLQADLIPEGGRPMTSVDFQNIHQQMGDSYASRSNISGGKWAGGPASFDFINLDEKVSHFDGSVSSDSSERTICDDGRTTCLSATVGSIVAIVAYDDPWAVEKMKVGDTMMALQEVRDQSEKLFQSSSQIRVNGNSLRELRDELSSLYKEDHILFTGCPLTVDVTLTNDRTDILFSVSQIDCCEFLTASSISDTEEGEHFDLFAFKQSSKNGSANFSLRIGIAAQDQKDSIVLTLGDCHTELDPSIVDRLSELIAPNPFFQQKSPTLNLDLISDPFNRTDYEANHQEKLLDFELRTASWSVNFRIPKADLTFERPFYKVKNVNKEYLEFELNDVHLKIPKLNLEKVAQFWQMKLTCSSLTGTFSGDPSLLQCSEEEMCFLSASRDRTIRENEDICIQLKYDSRNRSLTTENPLNSDLMTKSVWGAFFESNDRKEGPFSQKEVIRDNETLIMVGNREELMDFGESCRKVSNLQLNVNIPILNVLLPSHKFYEVLYNRLLNDLLLWQPSSPAFKSDSKDIDSVQRAIFESFTEDSDLESENSFEGTVEANENNHDITVTLDVDQFAVVLGTSKGQLLGQLQKTQLFVVNGYHGNPELTYFYISSDSTAIHHRSCHGGSPYHHDVRSSKFGSGTGNDDICVAPLDESCPLVNFLDDHRSALSMKIQNDTVKGVITKQDYLIAVALHNTEARLKLFKESSDFWVNQVVDFFKVEDYGVPGYVLPECNIQLRFNIRSSVVSYDHKQVNKESNMKLKLAIGSCDFSCQVLEDQKTTTVQCILEDTDLLASNQESFPVVRFSDESLGDYERFIPLITLGYFQFDLSMGQSEGVPTVSVKCKNDEIKAYFCADSLSSLINVLGDISSSEFLKAVEERAPEEGSEDHGTRECLVLEEASNDPRISFDCGQVQMLDEFFEEEAQQSSGESRMRSLSTISGKRPTSVSTRQERYYKQTGPSSTLVPGSQHIVNIDVKDITVRLFLFGGNDFGYGEGELKSYSNPERRTRIKKDVCGGRFRDESVKIEFLFQKMSCRFEQYDTGCDTSHALLLSMHNMEVIDHLAVSDIKKMLYRNELSDCHKRSTVPMIAFRVMATRSRGTKFLASASPVRMNIDQDSLEFLIDFFAEVSDLVTLLGECEPNEYEHVDGSSLSNQNTESMDYSYLFDERDLGEESDREINLDLVMNGGLDLAGTDGTKGNSGEEALPMDNIREFTFSPAVSIKIDYVGKRVKTDRGGALVGFLIGVSNLHSAEIRLKELSTTKGVSNLDRCLKYAAGEWLSDIRNYQLTKLVSSYGPLSSLSQLAGGALDLVALPLAELGKSDGNVVKGVQRGASSFGVSTLATVVDFTQGIASTVKGISEMVHHAISPEYISQKQSRSKRPGDFRAGVCMAMDTVKDGACSTVGGLHRAAYDSDDYTGFLRLRRLVTSVLVRPVVYGSQAAVQLLGGLQCQLQPEQHKEELSKWRN
uniref:Autophagy-related protein 2 n=1 Tax=Steinernema glaseri TaxID=37863 RepID=A0A1I8AS57_9BILA